jgi:iron(III) transport system substrate-binding protein
MSVRLIRFGTLMGLLGIAASVAACGEAPTDSNDSGAPGGSGASLEEVYQEVEGLTGEERMNRLVEMAEENGGKVGWYYVGDMTALIEPFEEATGLDVADYQTISEDLAERAGQEHETDQQGSDLLLGAGVDLRTMDEEGILAPLETPALDDVDQSYKGANAISPYANLMVTSYNTDLVPSDQQPTSYEDLFGNPPGNMGIEIGDWQWYQNLVLKYFVEQKGMTEQEAIDLITRGVQGSQQVEGHSLISELLASGEYAATPHSFAHSTTPLIEDEAPIALAENSADMPAVILINTMGLTEGGPNPAGGLALLEWLMSEEGQGIFADLGYVIPSNAYTGESVLDQYPDAIEADLYLTDTPQDQDEWQTKYDELLQAIGGDTESEE